MLDEAPIERRVVERLSGPDEDEREQVPHRLRHVVRVLAHEPGEHADHPRSRWQGMEHQDLAGLRGKGPYRPILTHGPRKCSALDRRVDLRTQPLRVARRAVGEHEIAAGVLHHPEAKRMEREQARELGPRGGEDGGALVVPTQSSLEPAELGSRHQPQRERRAERDRRDDQEVDEADLHAPVSRVPRRRYGR